MVVQYHVLSVEGLDCLETCRCRSPTAGMESIPLDSSFFSEVEMCYNIYERDDEVDSRYHHV